MRKRESAAALIPLFPFWQKAVPLMHHLNTYGGGAEAAAAT
jgi:hypothetical protein